MISQYENFVDVLLSNINCNNLIIFFKSLKQETSFSYREILEKSFIVSQNLKNNGVKKNDVVCIMLPTCQELIVSIFGVMMSGGIFSCLYPPLRFGQIDIWASNIAGQLETAKSKTLITNYTLFPVLGHVLDKIDRPIEILFSSKLINKQGLKIAELPLERNIEIEASKIKRSDIAFIQFSSGTTGISKAVCITHNNLISNISAILNKSVINISNENYSCLTWLPLYHDMGLVGSMMSSFALGAKLVLIAPEQFLANPILWFSGISKHKIAVSLAPNFAYGLMLKRLNPNINYNFDLSSLKILMSGADTIYKETVDDFYNAFKQYGLKQNALMPVYGMSETTLAATFSNPKEIPLFTAFYRDKLENEGIAYKIPDIDIENQRVRSENILYLVSLGTPVDGLTLEIRAGQRDVNSLTNLKVPENRLGTIFFKGSSVTQKYFNDMDETHDKILNSWLNTGDRGFIYNDNLYLFGRNKDILITNGRNIEPAFIENSLKMDFIRTGCLCVFGFVDYKECKEKIIVLAESRDDNFAEVGQIEIDKREKIVKDFIRTNHGLDIETVIFLKHGTLRRTSSGKIQRHLVKELFLKNELNTIKKNSKVLLGKSMISGIIKSSKKILSRRTIR